MIFHLKRPSVVGDSVHEGPEAIKHDKTWHIQSGD